MPRSDYVRCKSCDRPTSVCGELSHTRLCGDCAVAELERNVRGIAAKAGPEYRRWRRGMVAWVADQLLDGSAAARHTGE